MFLFLKRKIKSVKNLKKITKALEIVSTVKLQKIKEKNLALKNFFDDLNNMFSLISTYINFYNAGKKRLVILFLSERWLCWNFNVKLIKNFYDDFKNKDIDVFIVWKKWFDYVYRLWFNIVWKINLKDNFTEKDLLPLNTYVMYSIENNLYWEIYLFFNYFISILNQKPYKIKIFPFEKNSDNIQNLEITIEPNIESLKKEFLRLFLNYYIYSAALQTKAWEYSSRMISMKNATDNSEKMIKLLTLAFNKTRQSIITKEISEIVWAKNALEIN